MSVPEERIPIGKTFSRREAVEAQINAAIFLFLSDNYPAAVNLALAAEDAMPESEEPYIFLVIQKHSNEMSKEINGLKNWLKHKKDEEYINIREFEVVLAIDRSVSKFIAVYKNTTKNMDIYFQWRKIHGY
ncbi:hypothetical protein [Methylobacterium sp. SyP6R]|uniref:hypothetical protein n=1 Tax=Methylobacterium sp. SyP6R TaxID=2718876 RepID=UPI001F3FD7CA|nr:hypothetical protein [Methylobacterium sp. SyP6R]MCF4126313.1 hypothetical protein [Methylobacterium sp. SyP6R]